MQPSELSFARRLALVILSLLSTILTAGVVYGFQAIRPVLIENNVFKDNTLTTDNEEAQESQILMLNWMFTIATTSSGFIILPVGILLDTLGPRKTFGIGLCLLLLGNVLFASQVYIPGFVFIAIAGPFLFVSNMHISLAFENYQGLYMAALNGSLDSSTLVYFLFQKIADGFNVGVSGLFLGHTMVTLVVGVGLYLLMPQSTFQKETQTEFDYSYDDVKGYDLYHLDSLDNSSSKSLRPTIDTNSENISTPTGVPRYIKLDTSSPTLKRRQSVINSERNEITPTIQKSTLPIPALVGKLDNNGVSFNNGDISNDDEAINISASGNNGEFEHDGSSPLFTSSDEESDGGVGRHELDTPTKDSTNFGNWAYLKGALLSNNFIWITISTALFMLRVNMFINSIDLQLQGKTGGSADSYISFFNFALPFFGIVSIPAIGAILDNFRPYVSFTILWVLVCGFNIFGLVPTMSIQSVTIILLSIIRPFCYSSVSTFVSREFGFAKFGTIYGIMIMICGIVNLVQYPIIEHAVEYQNNQDVELVGSIMGSGFFYSNVVFGVLFGVWSLFPYYLSRRVM